jgi:hypothetical protein
MNKAEAFIKKTTYATAEVELPTGRVVELRRPPLRAWALAGVVPSFFTADVRDAWESVVHRGRIPVDMREADPEDFAHMLVVVRALARWAFVDPRLEDGADGSDGAVCPTMLAVEDWQFLFQWFTSGSPEVDVETMDGVVQVSDLHFFHNGQRW